VSDFHEIERLALLEAPEDLGGNTLVACLPRVVDVLDEVHVVLDILIHEFADLLRKLRIPTAAQPFLQAIKRLWKRQVIREEPLYGRNAMLPVDHLL